MFNNVRLFFILRIVILFTIGFACYGFFALQQFTPLAEFPNLWEVIITSIGAAGLAGGSFYLSRYRLLGRIDDLLMGEIDKACNYLIEADDPQKLKAYGDRFTPKLLVEQVGVFGRKILRTFCQERFFPNAKGGMLCLRDPILPLHPLSIYPEKLEEQIDSSVYKFIDQYLLTEPEEIAILRTDNRKRVNDITDVSGKTQQFESPALAEIIRNGITLPHEKAIVTPIFMKSSNIGYLTLFYKSQPFIYRIFNPRELIDNYMLKKIEDWKLDDAIQAIIERERLLLSFYLEKVIDDETTPQIRKSMFTRKSMDFHSVCEKILEAISKILKIDKGGFLYHNGTDELICYTESLSDEEIHRKIVPYTKSLLASNKKKVASFKISSMDSALNLDEVDFENVIYVRIEYENDDLGLLGLFATRDIIDFDKFVLDIIEDIKLDDLFLHYQSIEN